MNLNMEQILWKYTDAIQAGSKVLINNDLIVVYGSAKEASELIENFGGEM